jgi:hypothetical protein
MRPPFYFVRVNASKVAHHWDYARDRRTRALCGHEYRDDMVWEREAWWRQAARKLEIKLERLQRSRSPVDQEVHRLRRHGHSPSWNAGS